MTKGELINVFERLLPIYKDAYKNDVDYKTLALMSLICGLCLCAKIHFNITIYGDMETYYKKKLDRDNNLFDYPKRGKDLKLRIDFMENEIKKFKK